LARLEAGTFPSEVSLVPHATTADIGATLRAAREDLGISVEEAAWRTRIKPDYLRALEGERFEEIGHHAVARGHLHTYARYLGLEADALAQEYRRRFEHSEPSPIERLNEQVKESRRPPKPKWLIAALVSSVVLVAAALTGVIRGPGPRMTPAGNALATLPASAEATGRPTAEATAVVPPAQTSPVTIVVVAQGRSWLRAMVDGTLEFEGIVAAGTSKTFDGSEQIDISIGNAGAMRLIVNGVDLGPPGRAGQVYRASFGPRGEIKPK
jgi:cytoskeleton protein RodZ